VLSACGASVAALGRTGQWEGALRRLKLRQQLVFPDDRGVDFWKFALGHARCRVFAVWCPRRRPTVHAAPMAADTGSTPVYLIMGVCGSGKTSLAQEIASRLGLAVHDADDYHPAANREKMQAGTPLDDHDRGPWLDVISAEAAGWARGGGALLACSALKLSYRAKVCHIEG
jgi:hypothetical protein